MVMCLGQGADLLMAQLMPLPLTIFCSSKSRLVFPFRCRLTQVVLDKIQEGRKTVVCVCVHARVRVCVNGRKHDIKRCYCVDSSAVYSYAVD